MDPLSIVVSSIALAETAKKAANLLRDCLGARANTQSLDKEVSETERVLQDAKAVLEKRSSHKQLPQDGISTSKIQTVTRR